MRNHFVTLIGTLAAVGCASGSASSGSPATPAGTSASASTERPLVATLNATNSVGNRVMGNVKLTPTANGYRAEISIRNGGGPQNKYPWVIRRGACGDTSGDILGSELAYRLLETRADGTASINGPLNLTVPNGTYHVDILSGTDPEKRNVVISCGILSPV
jgi:hypothetical protein